ncbi:anaphase-promoting complex subunit 3 [Angomonas deanei]|uniref:Tetratricopeptide repeat, putative n=1 Tax=Angomonas deanei TaxID=59799 RepID=A0A7G2CT74_9TRYP|nr:anaphase-promoting complex subunit 3 [Angomonas deanei]CAD2222479.1 Tetratricopeptide repeat, putative [Angomonas deanei]|eukprot:EPY32203.1 anaphase-promoting complex subunit 3 [Angomonas deanei]
MYYMNEVKLLIKNPSFPMSTYGKKAAHGNDATVARRPSAWQLTHLALALFHEGNMQACADTFAQLLTYNPWFLHDPSLVYYSTALWHLKDVTTLGALAQRMLEELPFAAPTLAVVANKYSLSKEPNEAIVMLERATQVDPLLSYAYALRGYELLYMDHKTEAGEAFRQALHVDRNLYIAYAGLGELHFRGEEVEFARQYFRKAISINSSPAILNRYAATFNRRDASMEELLQALSIYDSAVGDHPLNLPARHQRADVLLRLGRLQEAQEELLQLAQGTPDAMVFVTLARCQECLNRPHEAIKYYHRALVLDPRREVYIKGCMERLAAGNED